MVRPFENPVFTIGHSVMDMGDLIRLLTVNLIDLVVDVRSIPYSRYAPQYNKNQLEMNLENSGIEYRFGGKFLGAFPGGRKPPQGMIPDYSALSNRPDFQKGIQRVLELAAQHRMVLLCSEENPVNCHRHNLIAPVLKEHGIQVVHLRKDGSRQPFESIPLKPSVRRTHARRLRETSRQQRLL